MPKEIELKFLVSDLTFKKESVKVYAIKQGFLNSNKNRVVRIRVQNEQAFITVKGLTSDDGTTRYEWERKIDLDDAETLLTLCEPTIISKTRFIVPAGNHIYEIDVFENDNEGLIIAEIELNTTEEKFVKPNWLGEEVTGQTKYYNSSLSRHPFKKWK